MKYVLIFFTIISFSQSPSIGIEATLLGSTANFEKGLLYIDDFGTSYFIQNNIINKTTNGTTLNYSNVQLGQLESVDLFNPLKILLFYKDFNSVIILDNRLAEISKIDFNFGPAYKNAKLISIGSENTFWVYNQDTQQLELFDYKLLKTKLTTLPLQGTVLKLISNYNYCWLLTETYLYKFNYFGSLIYKTENEGFTDITQSNGNLILKKENSLYLQLKNDDSTKRIELPELLITAFFVNHETLYLCDDKFLYKYQLKIE